MPPTYGAIRLLHRAAIASHDDRIVIRRINGDQPLVNVQDEPYGGVAGGPFTVRMHGGAAVLVTVTANPSGSAPTMVAQETNLPTLCCDPTGTIPLNTNHNNIIPLKKTC